LYPNKTTDPEARDFDRSVELFRAGVRAARAGDLETGQKKIAAAYLLDRRIEVRPRLDDPEAENYIVDVKLLQTLMRPGGDDAAQSILQIVFAVVTGNCKFDQELTAGAMLETGKLLKTLEDNPSMEGAPTVLEGCLNRPILHSRRADICYAANNVKKAIKEQTAALKLNPNLSLIRAYRAEIYCLLNWKDDEQLFQECQRVVDQSHPDARHLTRTYGWMSILVLRDPIVGTYTDACMLKEKMEKHAIRMVNLYGVTEEAHQSNVKIQTKVRHLFNHTDKKERKSLDTIPKEQLTRNPDVPARTKVKYFCMHCGKPDKIQGVTLSKCSACKQVCYCSKECQRAGWKEHKEPCKMLQLDC
jgi:tetratricopeptide (TPR) repeat protein